MKTIATVVLFVLLMSVAAFAQGNAGNAGTLEGTQVAQVSQADLDAANARAAAAEQKLSVAGQQVAEARGKVSGLEAQLADLKVQHARESAAASKPGSQAVSHRQRASLLALQISGLQARISRGETGGAASKWAVPAVEATLKSGQDAGMVGEKPNTTPKDKYWRKAATNQQVAAIMDRLRTSNAANIQSAVTAHNDNANAHPLIQEAITGEATERENADKAMWNWIYGLAAGVLIALIVGFIGWFLPRQRREREAAEYREQPIAPNQPPLADYEEDRRPFGLDTVDAPPNGGQPPVRPADEVEIVDDEEDIPEFLRRRDPEPAAPAATPLDEIEIVDEQPAAVPAAPAAEEEQELDITLEDEGADEAAASEEPAPAAVLQPEPAAEQPTPEAPAYVRPLTRRPVGRRLRPRGR